MRAVVSTFFLILLIPYLLTAQQALSIETEVKINPASQKLAGTLTVEVRQPSASTRIGIPSGLMTDKVLVNGQRAEFTQSNGEILISLRESSIAQTLQVVFYGTPAAEVAMFSVDEEGLPWISLREGEQRWRPQIPDSWQLPDSMTTAVIVDAPLRPVSAGATVSASRWPGGSTRWRLRQKASDIIPLICIGKYIRFTNRQNQAGRVLDWTYWVPSCRLDQAQAHYAQLPAMVETFERWWGRGYAPVDRVWIEAPGQLANDGRSLYTTAAPGYSPELLRQVVESWLGDAELIEFSPVRESLFQYASILWVHRRFSEEAFLQFLEKHRQDSERWGGWLIYHLTGNSPLPIELFTQLHNPSVTDEELRSLIASLIHPEFEGIARQYFDMQILPLLELKLVKKRRRWQMEYKWSGAHSEFVWPVELVHRDEIIELNPELEWQNFAWPKGGGKSYHIDESQGLFEIRSRS